MKIRRVWLAGVMVAAMASQALATTTIGTEQVGTYVGNLSFKTHSFQTGETTTTNEPIQIVLNANDSFTVSSGATTIVTSVGTYAPTFGILPYADPGRAVSFSLYFKNGKIKGLYSDVTHGTTGAFLEGKFSAKKQ